MTGTTGATFQVVFSNAAGLLGFRAIESGRHRVRVEPAEGYVLNLAGWKQPGQDEQNRYSAVAYGPEGLAKLVATAAAALQSAANGD